MGKKKHPAKVTRADVSRTAAYAKGKLFPKGKRHRSQKKATSQHSAKALGLTYVTTAREARDKAVKAEQDAFRAQIARIGDKFAERWETVTKIKVDDAWKIIATKMNEYISAVDSEDPGIEVCVATLSRLIKERAAILKLTLNLNLFCKFRADNGKLYYLWTVDEPGRKIVVQKVPGWSWEAGAQLSVKERASFIRGFSYQLLDTDIMDLYMVMLPYL